MIQEIILPLDVELPPAKILKAGAITCMYEMGNLRYIRFGNTELVRKIYGAVRNQFWGTISCDLQNEILTVNESGFSISYTAVYREKTALYKADYRIEGKEDNSIIFSMKGEAVAFFKRNRIGLCVHHPVNGCRGKEIVIKRPDGTSYQSTFPNLVSPLQPFHEVRQMQWVTEGNITVELMFEGDVFETEDQRNWSDSSYKTYSTPLDMPFPVAVKPGDIIAQSVTIHVSGIRNNYEIKSQAEAREEKIRFPQIGYSRSKEQPSLKSSEINWLHSIPFNHYRISLSMNGKEWMQELHQAISEGRQLNTQLELIVFFSDAYAEELNRLMEHLKEGQDIVRAILVLQQSHTVSPPGLLEYIYPILKKTLPTIQIGYGTDYFFADLNRQRPGQTPYDFISFSLHPQVHAVDNRSLLENLENQPDIVETATDFTAGKHVCISPITLKGRDQFVAHQNNDTTADKRQYSWLAAYWTLISIQQFSKAFSITFYELFGEAGILRKSDNQNGEIKPSPVYEMLVAINNFHPAWVIKRWVGQDLTVDGLMLENENGDRLFFRTPAEGLKIKE